MPQVLRVIFNLRFRSPALENVLRCNYRVGTCVFAAKIALCCRSLSLALKMRLYRRKFDGTLTINKETSCAAAARADLQHQTWFKLLKCSTQVPTCANAVATCAKADEGNHYHRSAAARACCFCLLPLRPTECRCNLATCDTWSRDRVRPQRPSKAPPPSIRLPLSCLSLRFRK